MASGLVTQVVLSLMMMALMGLVVATRKKIGALWITLAFLALLATFAVRRIDAIGAYFGVDVIDNTTGDVVSFVVLLVLLLAFVNVWRRREEIKSMEERIEELERLRASDERRSGKWIPADSTRE